ncbi:uncharacterized protein LOC131841538 [Achroia grisella]|uniref:uncharacterized protein LOC131841538 n=1 Tax=Achroia grisella TaxID=688607 RepID=UPI0027D2613F|nr:uncharacterized protein LOC131841538 [Achroia grisella]
MAFNDGLRFPPTPKYFKLLDPGAYQKGDKRNIKLNTVPFLSKTPRNTQDDVKIWTHAIYDVGRNSKIPNCTSIKSIIPRFPYEAFNKDDLEKIICLCSVTNVCDHGPKDEETEKKLCQVKVHKCLYKGPPPRSILGDGGLSAPSKWDNGFYISLNGSQKRIRNEVTNNSPPFYDVKVNEHTGFYRGWKWSKWTTQREEKSFINDKPCPSDYFLKRELLQNELCAETVRAFKRKTSKQLRFIEIVQQRNISEGRPGPASYSPNLPKGFKVKFVGPKAKRFVIPKYVERPGPADYFIKRTFETRNFPQTSCHAKLYKPAAFGIKSQRFKSRREEGPSPASYNIRLNPCQFMHCPVAPFGSSSVRFLDHVLEEDNDGKIESQTKYCKVNSLCCNPTWGFKSKTIRMKPLIKNNNEPSPADLPQSRIKLGRHPQVQSKVPFLSLQGRFQPWYDWMPVFGCVKTPGPCYYSLEHPKCLPAVHHNSLFRAPRFPIQQTQTPAPNEYEVGGGLETILNTHNQKLKSNIVNQRKFHWIAPMKSKNVSYEEHEMMLIYKAIALLEVSDM